MNSSPNLASVDNKTIRFAVSTPPGTRSAILGRRAKVVGPDSVLQLIENPDTSLLPALIDLLKDPDRAWAAEVILTSLTAGDAKIIESFSGEPDQWWDGPGKNAFQHWNNWYLEHKDKIQWNSSEKLFRLKE